MIDLTTGASWRGRSDLHEPILPVGVRMDGCVSDFALRRCDWTGTAFHAGVLTALADHFDAREAKIIVGTSAGSTAAALDAQRFSTEGLRRAGGRAADVRRGEGHPRRDAALSAAANRHPDPADPRPRSSRAILKRSLEIPSGSCSSSVLLPAGTRPMDPGAQRLRSLFEAWPQAAMWLIAVDLQNGQRPRSAVMRRRPWGRSGGLVRSTRLLRTWSRSRANGTSTAVRTRWSARSARRAGPGSGHRVGVVDGRLAGARGSANARRGVVVRTQLEREARKVRAGGTGADCSPGCADASGDGHQLDGRDQTSAGSLWPRGSTRTRCSVGNSRICHFEQGKRASSSIALCNRSTPYSS